MTRMTTYLSMVALATCTLGCGTALNFEKGGLENPKIYGGVAASMEMAKTSAESSPIRSAAFIADVPLSFVGDTLTLPITLTAAVIHSNSAKSD